MAELKPIQSQITFLYYQDLQPIAAFYEEVLRLVLVDDQQWARIYRLSGNAYVGIVDGNRGFHRPQQSNAVLLTLVVDDVPGWYNHLREHGVELLSELQYKEDIQIRCFFFRDPGGYTFEVQQFLQPHLAGIFHQPT